MPCASATQSSVTRSIEPAALAGILYCPDDGATLACGQSRIECSACGRRFQISEDGVVDLLPLRHAEIAEAGNTAYWNEYKEEIQRPYKPNPMAIAWGAPEISGSAWLRKRLRQVRGVRPLIADSKFSKSQIFCDIAAGAGNYTLAYASDFRIVLHCDLSASNLSYAARKAKRLGVRNVYFLRVDYFSLPLANSIDRVVCLDTLIRGERHEIALLQSIRKSLRPEGHAIVDFHNWWHNPLRRLGLLRQNFGENRSYRRTEAEALLRKAGIELFDFTPFYQEFDGDWKKRRFATSVLQPARLLYRFQGASVDRVIDADAFNLAREEFHVAEL